MLSIHFNKTGEQRKALVTTIGEVVGIKPKYMGAPGFMYSIGGYTVTKDGTLECGGQEDVSTLISALEERGFVPVDAPDFIAGEANSDTQEETVGVAGTELDGAFAIDLPAEGMDELATENLRKLVLGKAPLIRAALGENLAGGANTLPVIIEDGKVSFQWFRLGIDADSIAAWSFFVCTLRDTAIRQKRVVLNEKPYDGSEKYAMRCFLLKLGFIGEEYKQARKILLANLSGDSSHKNPKEDAPAPTGDEQDAKYERAEALADAELIHSVNVFYEDGDVDEGERLVRGGLCGVPATDVNYPSYLRRATDAQLYEAIAHMEAFPQGQKGRITACRRELAKRKNTAGSERSGIADKVSI
ncbi:hypothetical protein LJC56_09825 [Christensenellaceae bacterium OttesenSCG-928-K19]|nr:hypothetical protein [Christensenellaceae bacterium OttesenSCG-928-K19]